MIRAVQMQTEYTAQELITLSSFRQLSVKARSLFSEGLLNVYDRELAAAPQEPRAPVLRLLARRGAV